MDTHTIHLMSQSINFGFELLNTHDSLISDRVMEFTSLAVPLAPLAWLLAIAPDL